MATQLILEKFVTRDPSYFIDRFVNNNPFSYVRYHDGEFFCLLGKKGMNGDRHTYFPKLSKDLQQAFLKPINWFENKQDRYNNRRGYK